MRMRTWTIFMGLATLAACGGKTGGRASATGTDGEATSLTTDSASSTTTNGTGSETSSTDSTSSNTSGATTSGASTDGCDPFCADVGIPPKMDLRTETCGESNYMLEAVTPNVLLVLDASGSMVNTSLYWDHDDDVNTAEVSRWFSLHGVVTFIADTFDTSMNLGLLFYPQLGLPKDCAIAPTPEVPVAPLQGTNVKAALPPPDAYDDLWQNPTPTCDALEIAYAHLMTLDPNIPAVTILVTDGVPSNSTCPGNDYPTCISRASAAFAAEIPTYLVGIDISATVVPDFNDLAEAGGVPKAGAEKFYNSKNQIELQAALEQIAGEVQSCIAPLNPPPDDPTMVQVQLDGSVVPKVTDCANEDGWVYVNPNGPYDAIELCGTYCEDFKTNKGEIVALYGCPPEG